MVALLCGPGLEVIKLEYSLKLKIKRNDWLLAFTCRVYKQPIIALCFELENEHRGPALRLYNLSTSSDSK